MKRLISVLAVLALAGCANGGLGGFGALGERDGRDGRDGRGGLFGLFGGGASAEVAPGDGVGDGAGAVTGEAAAEDIAPADSAARAAAVAEGDTEGGERVRGFTVASLGDATEPGLWIETPLVSRERAATVVAPNGTTVVVTARPSGGERGSGSRLSLAAFQALGLDLTSLPTVTVIAD